MSRSLNMKWRQGAILLANDLCAITSFQDKEKLAIAISHSCDILNDAEPTVEFISAVKVGKIDGNCTYGKHYRKLHLELKLGDELLPLELIANEKFQIPKERLQNYEPDKRHMLTQNQVEILQSWLSARYKRQTLPDNLHDRLEPVLDFLKDQGKRNAENVLGYWINYDPHEELSEKEVYDFFLYIVYSLDKKEYEDKAKSLAETIKEKFSALIQKNRNRGEVQLLKCEAFSEEQFTLGDMRRNILFRLDHLSYRTDPHGPTI